MMAVDQREPYGSQGPAEPFADAAAHDPLEILALQPWQVLGEERDALIVGIGHPREVRTPFVHWPCHRHAPRRAADGRPWCQPLFLREKILRVVRHAPW